MKFFIVLLSLIYLQVVSTICVLIVHCMHSKILYLGTEILCSIKMTDGFIFIYRSVTGVNSFQPAKYFRMYYQRTLFPVFCRKDSLFTSEENWNIERWSYLCFVKLKFIAELSGYRIKSVGSKGIGSNDSWFSADVSTGSLFSKKYIKTGICFRSSHFCSETMWSLVWTLCQDHDQLLPQEIITSRRHSALSFLKNVLM